MTCRDKVCLQTHKPCTEAKTSCSELWVKVAFICFKSYFSIVCFFLLLVYLNILQTLICSVTLKLQHKLTLLFIWLLIGCSTHTHTHTHSIRSSLNVKLVLHETESELPERDSNVESLSGSRLVSDHQVSSTFRNRKWITGGSDSCRFSDLMLSSKPRATHKFYPASTGRRPAA